MIAKLKLAAYVILSALAIWYGREFYSSYTNIGQNASGPATNSAAGNPVKSEATNSAPPVTLATGSTNVLSTNSPAATNSAGTSNLVQQPVAPSTTNSTATNVATPAPLTANNSVTASNAALGGRTVKFLAAFVLSMVGLGLLIAYDVTQLMGAKAVEYLFNDDAEGERDPEYEQAEQTWVNGKPLEAIEMMREYLKKNPREQYVALRIAEIYEKDLRNYVAASLEYEEILKKRLRPDHWGRAAIKLCNVYGRMGKQEQRKELLERIARDYPKTAAAKKARQNLGLPEPEEEAAPAPPPEEPDSNQTGDQGKVFNLDEVIATPDEEPPPAPEPEPEATAPEPPKSNLPPGFRKKK